MQARCTISREVAYSTATGERFTGKVSCLARKTKDGNEVKHFLVTGLGQFGHQVAISLNEGGGDVLAVDQNPRRVEKIKDSVGQAVCMDSTDIEALRAMGAQKMQTAVIALGEEDLEASVLTCVALSDLGVGKIVVRAANELQGRILNRVGATKIVYPEKEMGKHVGNSLLMSGVIDQVTLSTGQVVAQILAKRELIGTTLKESQLRKRYGINVIGIERHEEYVDDYGVHQVAKTLEDVPEPDARITEKDVLIVVGNQAQIELVARKD
jgi:trk system potassium uptake protein